MIKWIVELSECDIEYQPKKAIKAQALSDFLTEMVHLGHKKIWRVFADGEANNGSAVGVVLISPTERKYR